MAGQVRPIPEGFHTATPYLTVRNGTQAIEFYKRAFGAQEKSRMAGPDGKLMHAELKIGDSIVMLADEMPGSDCRSPQSLNGTTGSVFLYVNDVDSVFNQAIQAGAKQVAAPQDMFWGDRFGKLSDPYGHSWALATHKEDVAPAEMERRGKEFMAKMATQTKRAG
jgi:PhnB protein